MCTCAVIHRLRQKEMAQATTITTAMSYIPPPMSAFDASPTRVGFTNYPSNSYTPTVISYNPSSNTTNLGQSEPPSYWALGQQANQQQISSSILKLQNHQVLKTILIVIFFCFFF